MRKLASFALVAAVGLSAVTLAGPADAGIVVGVGVPPVAVAPSPVAVYGAPAVAVGAYPGFYGRYYPHRFYPGPRYGYWGGFYHRGWYHGRYWR